MRRKREQPVLSPQGSDQFAAHLYMSKRKAKVDWARTPAGGAEYTRVRAEAQAKANETGFDYGLERNDLFKTFCFFLLPGKASRFGHELQCEVVMCEIVDKCQPGHGPHAKDRGW